MPSINNLGREKLDWSEEIWNQIDNEVHDQVNRIARVRKAITPKMTAADALTISSNPFQVKDRTLFSDEAGTEREYEIKSKFLLTGPQVKRVGQGDLTASILAGRAAVEAAFAEDLVLLTGGLNNRDNLLDIVSLNSGAPSVGLLEAAANTINVPFRNPEEAAYGENTYNAIVQAVSLLIGLGENGPYTGIFSFETFADMNRALPNRLDTPHDRAKEVLTEGIFSSGAMPPGTALIVSLGGHACDHFIGNDFLVRYNFTDESGNYRFEVFGREALIIRVKNALIKLAFELPAVVRSAKRK